MESLKRLIWKMTPEQLQPSVHKSKSSLKSLMTRNVHEWTIEDFEQRFSMLEVDEPRSRIQSALFSVFDKEKEHTFQMYLTKSGDEEGIEVDKMVSVWLRIISNDPVNMSFEISENNLILFEMKMLDPKLKNINSFSSETPTYGYKNLMKITNLPLTNGTLTLFVYMEIHRWTDQNEVEVPHEPSDKGLVIERTRLANLSDFTLVCGTTEIKAHKVVLASNCNFFEAMFRHDCLESNNNQMKVVDLETDTLEQMIELMYNHQPDRLPSETDSLVMLLHAADKYGFEFLRNCVERKLIKIALTMGTSAGLLQMALHFNAPFLQAESKKMLLANLALVRKTEDFANLMMAFPDCLRD